MSRGVCVLIGILLLALLRQCGPAGLDLPPTPDLNGTGPAIFAPLQSEVRVQRVVDGDTLLLEGGERVRLLGVDTPETVKPNNPVEYLGPEASAFTRSRVEGKTVTLVFDKERFDKYQRVLAFVYVGEVCLNEELIRQGLSKAQLQYPYRSEMKRRFQAAETEARAHRRGLWGSGSQPVPAAGEVQHRPQDLH